MAAADRRREPGWVESITVQAKDCEEECVVVPARLVAELSALRAQLAAVQQELGKRADALGYICPDNYIHPARSEEKGVRWALGKVAALLADAPETPHE